MKRWINESLEIEIALIVGKRLQLGSQLHDFHIGDAHLMEEFFDSFEFDLAIAFVFSRQETEGIPHVDLCKLLVFFQGENAQELVQAH